jgi:hypothetical protein
MSNDRPYTDPKPNNFKLTGHGARLQSRQLLDEYAEPFAPRVSPVYCCVVVTSKVTGKPSRCSNERKFYGKSNMTQCCRVHISRENAAKAWMAAEGIDD